MSEYSLAIREFLQRLIKYFMKTSRSHMWTQIRLRNKRTPMIGAMVKSTPFRRLLPVFGTNRAPWNRARVANRQALADTKLSSSVELTNPSFGQDSTTVRRRGLKKTFSERRQYYERKVAALAGSAGSSGTTLRPWLGSGGRGTCLGSHADGISHKWGSLGTAAGGSLCSSEMAE